MYVLRLLSMALLFDNEMNKFCRVVNYNRIVDENVVLRQSAVLIQENLNATQLIVVLSINRVFLDQVLTFMSKTYVLRVSNILTKYLYRQAYQNVLSQICTFVRFSLLSSFFFFYIEIAQSDSYKVTWKIIFYTMPFKTFYTEFSFCCSYGFLVIYAQTFDIVFANEKCFKHFVMHLSDRRSNNHLLIQKDTKKDQSTLDFTRITTYISNFSSRMFFIAQSHDSRLETTLISSINEQYSLQPMQSFKCQQWSPICIQ